MDDDGMSIDDSEKSGFSDFGGELGTATMVNLTRRQRAKLTHGCDAELIELPLEAKRSKFSVEEAALRKSEHARRRKFQSLQRAEQLKIDTINRLLNKQTSKGRNKVADDSQTRSANGDISKVAPGTVRYVQRCQQNRAFNDTRQSDPSAAGDSGAASDSGTPVHIECALYLSRDTDIRVIIPSATQKGEPPKYPQPPAICSVASCQQQKKYSVATLAACSLEHWRVLSANKTDE
ncbi:INO80 complex subunit B [Kickxella alabastrina]|nr:INO80 complex subunit B [Kickxella alabastrina]